jgi:hypothetical protein
MNAKIAISTHRPLTMRRGDDLVTYAQSYTVWAYDSFEVKDLCKAAGMKFDHEGKRWFKDTKTMDKAVSIASSIGPYKVYDPKSHGKFGDFLANFWNL